MNKKFDEWRKAALSCLRDYVPHLESEIPENDMQLQVMKDFLRRVRETIKEGEKL